MELSFHTRINLIGVFIGIVTMVSDHLFVYGQRSNRFTEGSLRLVGGRTKHEGTVLIYHWSRWGSICDDYWDVRDANVVCNELGYPGALQAPRRSRFGKGRRRVWLSGLHCRGNERHLTMCYSRGWGNYLRRCRNYFTAAGVVCRPKPDGESSSTSTTTTTTTTITTTTKPRSIVTTPKRVHIQSVGEIRNELRALPTANANVELQSGDSDKLDESSSDPRPATSNEPTAAPAQAPLEIRQPAAHAMSMQSDSPSDKTSTKKSVETTEKQTVPITRSTTTTTTQLPTTTTTTTTRRPTTVTTTTTTPVPTTRPTTTTTTTKRPTTVTTTTTTTTKKPTTPRVPRVFNRWVYDRESWRYFMYFRDGSSITSRPDPRYYRQRRTSTMRPTTTTTTTTTPRPTTRSTTTLPRTPRPRTFNLHGISNALNQRSNEDELRNTIDVVSPQNIRQRPVNNMIRHESRHGQRQHPGRKQGYVGDQPAEDATVNEIPMEPATTTPRNDAPNFTEFRVVGGREYEGFLEGRIEIRLAGSNSWGVLCGDDWDMRGTITACKHFGVGSGRTAQKTDFYGGSNLDKVVSILRCTGREDRLEDCKIERAERTPGKEACSKSTSVAGIICETRLPDLEPDVSALQHSVYLQDRYSYYLTCAQEEGCLSSSANEIFGTRRWDYATRRLLRFSTIAINKGKADFRPNIDRSQWEWHACHMHFHSMEAFSHYDIIDHHGNKIAEGHKASFCLEDSACNRGVPPKYDCQMNGNQGISVGCRDSYLHDIDCQWIDVTDVKVGLYTLKVEINPGMLVAETSFDNNVATCQLYISSSTARAWDCKLDSLL